MIRQLLKTDRDAAIALLRQQPEINLYMLGNIETAGFERDFCHFWGDFDDSGMLRGVACRYFVNWDIYGVPSADWQAIANLIDTDPQGARLQDNPSGIDSILPLLANHANPAIQVETLMRLNALDFVMQPVPEGVTIRRATLDDLDMLADLYRDAGDMSRTRAGVERPLRDTTVFVAERNGEILSVALTNAEIADMAMVGGVYTPERHRSQGLARATVGTLCACLLAGNKTPVLYWDTPAAGKVYQKLGFKAIGKWRAVRL